VRIAEQELQIGHHRLAVDLIVVIHHRPAIGIDDEILTIAQRIEAWRWVKKLGKGIF
jgi:hypothetical protein